jgi:hypothetical protein
MGKEKSEMRSDTDEKIPAITGNLESSIISANKKYFGIDLESRKTKMEPSLLYETLIGYFNLNGDSCII